MYFWVETTFLPYTKTYIETETYFKLQNLKIYI